MDTAPDPDDSHTPGPQEGLAAVGAATRWNVQAVPTAGEALVAIQIEHASGVTLVGVSPDSADQIAKQLQRTARQARLEVGPKLQVPRLVGPRRR